MSKRLGALLRETQAGLQFVSTWRVSAANLSIRLPLEAHGEFDFLVDWGDGKQDKITAYDQPEVEHTYMKSGNYVVRMQGKVYGFAFGFSSVYRRPHSSCSQIVDISHWGDVRLGTKGYQFYACENLRLSAQDVPNLSNVFDLSSMFEGARSFTGDLREWDTSKVDNMSKMFKNAVVFNCNLSSWNTSAVTDMEQMFAGASAFNSALRWDTRMCLSMRGMFQGATAFNGDVSTWDTSKVRTMEQMFNGASSFNGDVSKWDVQAATSMAGMFMRTRSFRNGDISKWKPSSSCKLDLMFYESVYSCGVSLFSTAIEVDTLGPFFQSNTWNKVYAHGTKLDSLAFVAFLNWIVFSLVLYLYEFDLASGWMFCIPFPISSVSLCGYIWRSSSGESDHYKWLLQYVNMSLLDILPFNWEEPYFAKKDRYIFFYPDLYRVNNKQYVETSSELYYQSLRYREVIYIFSRFVLVLSSVSVLIGCFLQQAITIQLLGYFITSLTWCLYTNRDITDTEAIVSLYGFYMALFEIVIECDFCLVLYSSAFVLGITVLLALWTRCKNILSGPSDYPLPSTESSSMLLETYTCTTSNLNLLSGILDHVRQSFSFLDNHGHIQRRPVLEIFDVSHFDYKDSKRPTSNPDNTLYPDQYIPIKPEHQPPGLIKQDDGSYIIRGLNVINASQLSVLQVERILGQGHFGKSCCHMSICSAVHVTM